MSQISMIKKLKELFSARESQKPGINAGITTGRKAEGRIVTPIGPACRREYHK